MDAPRLYRHLCAAGRGYVLLADRWAAKEVAAVPHRDDDHRSAGFGHLDRPILMTADGGGGSSDALPPSPTRA